MEEDTDDADIRIRSDISSSSVKTNSTIYRDDTKRRLLIDHDDSWIQ